MIPDQPPKESGVDATVMAPSAGAASGHSPSLLGRNLGHYQLVTLIGKGSMGEVYQARDTRLDRLVAIKVLAPHLAQRAVERQRFEREARTIAKLNHPHICTLYDIGFDGDLHYLVMEYLDGETLADLLLKRPLSLEQALRYGSDMADALDQVHRKGITHRDIKPKNVIVTRDDWLKVLDFGVAKLADDSKPSTENKMALGDAAHAVDQLLTKRGSIMGTIAYMSPEQAGGTEIDTRSDIFSFGAVLYEMISNQRPFQKETAGKTLSAILREEPKPLRPVIDSVPPELEEIIGRCLRKEPTLRFHSMADVKTLLGDLLKNTGSLRSQEIPSVAVLPFSNLSPEPENEYFSDGLTEELIAVLSQVPQLRVVSRTSAFQFRGKDQDIREVGRRLGVNFALAGSVRRAGNRIRIAAELVNVSDGCSIWSESFERELAGVFEIQDEVTRTILAKLKPKLVTSPPSSKKASGQNMQAHELYLKGRYLWNQQTPAAVTRARDYFEQAIAVCPEHAMAHVGLADSCLLLGWYGLSPASDSMSKAKSAAQAALALDDTLALAHCSMALVYAGYDWNWPRADERFTRALELGPGFSAIHFHYALDYLTPMGRLEEAGQEIMLAQELDPLSLITRTALGGCLYRKRQYDAAIAQCQNTLEINPNFYHAHWSLARAFEQKYLYEEAVGEFQKADDLSGKSNPQIRGELGHCYARMSQVEKAKEILNHLQELSRHVYVAPLSKAFVFLGLREMDQAVEQLRVAFAQRSRPLVWINVDPRFEPLHSDNRFGSILKGMGLPE